MARNRFTGNWLFQGGAAIVLAFFVFAMATHSPGQTKKTDSAKEKDKAKDKDKTETGRKDKVEPPPTKFPVRKDLVDPTMGTPEHVALIDEHIMNGWKSNKTFPSDRCTDFEFIRRATLDIVGRIPTVEEIARFMKEPETKRRSWLINAMLDGKEYGSGYEFAKNFANLWTVHLMTRTGSAKHYQDQMNDWLLYQFKEGDTSAEPSAKKESGQPDWSKTAYQLIAGTGTTNRNAAVNYLLHNLGEEIRQDMDKRGKWDMVPATSRTTRLFLGIRTQCVQCHDHPFNGEWRQEHFWGVNAFFRQADSAGRPPLMMQKNKKGKTGSLEFTLSDRRDYNSTGMITFERRNAVVLSVDPSFLDGQKIPETFKGSRREALAKFVIASPFFSKAWINRAWGHFFGMSFTRGLVDDFHEQNPVSHPELLEKLATDWAKNYSHNPKVLIRWICNSQAYGLNSKANKWNDKVEDETLFARMLLKPMTPEQMFASVNVATHARWQSYSDEKKKEKLEGKKGEEWSKKLTDNFGNDEGEEGSYSGTVVQALLLMNGREINEMIADKDEGTANIIAKKRGAMYKVLPYAIQDMYMHVLNRPATEKEVKDFMSETMYLFPRRPGMAPPNLATPAFWISYYEDVMWALLNSNEFILNH
jgi:hypothetical protein